MNRGLIFLLSDSAEIISDVGLALGVVDVNFQVFNWSAFKDLLNAASKESPTFILCHLGDKNTSQASDLPQLTLICDAKENLLSDIPLISLGEIVGEAKSDLFAGKITLPLQFPATPQLLQRLVTESLIVGDQG